MKFKYAILYVENVEKTLDFYQRAFGFKKSFLHESGDYGELDTGSTTISFSSLALMNQLGKGAVAPNPSAPVFELAFETDDVPKALHQAVNAGAELVQDAQDMPWGQTIGYVHDLNGFLIEICTPVQG
ncbi:MULTISPECIES: VOC family protein [Providencia]|uniref:VOC family protein n=2 Tax=Providencia alcalifaciens TaxID=126385 RepID=A0AAW9V9N0_9GAMM|nr:MULTISPECIES: VOC family protein [Providencia]EKT65367.1 glyoxalase/bleomycin resistance protein/dioxygenase [Providencia alcalifaciens Dmel2]ETT08487.1 glyoxalase-like domain protein [Providencia alcalifaciens F90-2004]EUC97007.1 glyoxalase-like domain protein [Providencia alcalifaciens PAL-2]EUD10013.1 glyoxalase-like domain protein [Providencia alcalifaciens 205/92]MTB31060.1 VOC family protein [Providencia alcalifaciens]